MKRHYCVALLCAIAYLTGYANTPRALLAFVQTQPAQTQKALPTLLEGKAQFWSSDDMKKLVVPSKGTLMAATPIYRLNMWEREYFDPPKAMTVSKQLQHWDDGEMHEDKTQLYVVVSGTGTILLGGYAEQDRVGTPGQHNGGPIIGGTPYKVKPGDWILIPPRTWHQVQPDRGGLVYGMVHIQTMTNVP
jgi:mannose-6-phosphate isomerase-like protein (cupin superfamily)